MAKKLEEIEQDKIKKEVEAAKQREKEKAIKFALEQKNRMEQEKRRLQAILDEDDRQERLKKQRIADELLAKMLKAENDALVKMR